MISDYGTLKDAISDEIARSDLHPRIPQFVQMAETKINRLRVREFEKAYSATIASNVTAVPADYMEMKLLRIDGYRPLQPMSIDQLYSEFPTRSATGVPTSFAREAESFIYGPAPDSGYSVLGTYYAKPAAMSNDFDAPALLARSPNLYFFGALVAAEVFVKNDERYPLWASLYQNEYQELQAESRREETSGGQLRVTRG